MSTDVPNPSDTATMATTPDSSLLMRLGRALGPALPGIVLDLSDALSLTAYFGPAVSFLVGFVIGVWLSTYYQFSWQWRVLVAVGSGLYTLTPGTAAIPLATILTCLGRFVENGSPTDASFAASTKTSNECDSTSVTDKPPQTAQPEREAERGARPGAKCPECSSSMLRYGQVGQRFWPSGSSTWAKGHEVHAFVCLNCGFVGHYLTTNDLNELEQSQS